jgi:hypothetical protein
MFDFDSPFAMVVAIVAIVFGTKVWRTHLLTRERSGRSSADDALIASLEGQVARLQERVGVLEKLVTDDERSLERELDRLARPDRDPPRA